MKLHQALSVAESYPKMIRVGQGAEILPRVLDLQAYPERVNLDFALYGKPTDIAFNGRFQAERLYQHSFLPADAAEKLKNRRKYYKRDSPTRGSWEQGPISLIIPTAPQVRRRDESRKLQLQTVRRMAAERSDRGSDRRWVTVQWQVNDLGRRRISYEVSIAASQSGSSILPSPFSANCRCVRCQPLSRDQDVILKKPMSAATGQSVENRR
ncbi:hypothetical protein GGR03_003524 [Aurantimonas endophytica]|uniref:Uncharacterized protein n=1 Tax=Aurantimonas endophytica TaxID=1522175 RepID=A0A7W6HFX6_9HYPH|nr:hypothetical protein [Aurantimonas endophytica]MCO6405274.1 hypothetical protein [Aurantimonas endophytica]